MTRCARKTAAFFAPVFGLLLFNGCINDIDKIYMEGIKYEVLNEKGEYWIC